MPEWRARHGRWGRSSLVESRDEFAGQSSAAWRVASPSASAMADYRASGQAYAR
jgi:hypothetical protein